jgi:hypothetical protein
MELSCLPRFEHVSITLHSVWRPLFSCISCVSWSFSFLLRERLPVQELCDAFQEFPAHA